METKISNEDHGSIILDFCLWVAAPPSPAAAGCGPAAAKFSCRGTVLSIDICCGSNSKRTYGDGLVSWCSLLSLLSFSLFSVFSLPSRHLPHRHLPGPTNHKRNHQCNYFKPTPDGIPQTLPPNPTGDITSKCIRISVGYSCGVHMLLKRAAKGIASERHQFAQLHMFFIKSS